MKVFVIHYKKLTDRKEFILVQFERNGITDYEFVEIDRDDLDQHDVSMFKPSFSKVHKAICLSHFYAYKQIAEKHEHALILEDDVVLSNDFTEKLTKYMKELPEDYDMLFIGDGCNLHIDCKPGKHIYYKSHEPSISGGFGATRCTDSYIVKKSCAIELCKHISSLKSFIQLPIDNWLNFPLRKMNFKVFWAEPTIVTQGTQNGLFSVSY